LKAIADLEFCIADEVVIVVKKEGIEQTQEKQQS
jgi:hypothetical protein